MQVRWNVLSFRKMLMRSCRERLWLLGKIRKGFMKEVTFELVLHRCIVSVHLHGNKRHTVMKTGERRWELIYLI